MSLDSFFAALPDEDVEKVTQALEHTRGGLIKVRFVGMHAFVLDGLEQREVINRCDRTQTYWRGENFEHLQAYYKVNIE